MFHDKGLEVIGVSFDTNKQQWLRSINELKMVWPQLSDLKGEMSIATEAWGIHSFPANVLIGPDGIIVASNLYNGALEDKVEELLK
jgi:alkyl hydroperoxide reductase subunit AhpC